MSNSIRPLPNQERSNPVRQNLNSNQEFSNKALKYVPSFPYQMAFGDKIHTHFDPNSNKISGAEVAY